MLELVRGAGGFPVGCLSWRTSRVDVRTGSDPKEAEGIIT